MESLPSFLSGVLVLLLCTSFVKMLTSLSILRYGLGLDGAGVGAVLVTLSMALSLVVIQPQLAGLGGVDALLSGKISFESAGVEKQMRPFIEKHADASVVGRIGALLKGIEQPGGKKAEAATVAAQPFSVILAAFMISELKAAFLLGLLFIVPFVVIDLLVANVLAALQVQQISTFIVALPFKLLLFIAVDGWTLVSEKLISGYL